MQIHAPILFVITLFPFSTALVLLCLSTLPITVSWPRTLTDVATLGRELHGYSQSGPGPMAHVIGVLSITAVWKHAWSIPGSVIWVRTSAHRAEAVIADYFSVECFGRGPVLSSTCYSSAHCTHNCGFHICNTSGDTSGPFSHTFLPTCPRLDA
jgi:hypothetical protein